MYTSNFFTWMNALGAMALATGCNAITGIGSYENVDCSGDCAGERDAAARDGSLGRDATGVADSTTDGSNILDATPDVADSSSQADSGSDASANSDAAELDGGADANNDASDASTSDGGGCPGTQGPSESQAGSFCIDSTEVTNAQYQQFLTAKGTDTSGQPTACAWNTTYVPATWPLASSLDNNPVAWVDWCDAYAFCGWAGKRLCGATGGGPVSTADANTVQGQWYSACSHSGDGLHPFAYGKMYVIGNCNVETTASDPVAANGGCIGGYSVIYDILGNVEEWIDACTGSSGASDACISMGHAFNDVGSTTECTDVRSESRNAQGATIGFRCCGP